MSKLVGQWFLTPSDDVPWPAATWQGSVEEEVVPGTYLVQLYSWMTGCPTEQRVVMLDQMNGWRFFTDKDEFDRMASASDDAHHRWVQNGHDLTTSRD